MKIQFALLSLMVLSVLALERGFTEHFEAWLKENGYEKYDFPRKDLEGGSYGGRKDNAENLVHIPVIFIHGYADIGVGVGQEEPWQTGCTATFEHFLSKGYTKAELYTTTWGEGDPDNELEN